MPNEILPFDKTKEPGLSRRMFGSLSLGGAAAVTTSAIAADLVVIENDVVIKMADGNCDAVLFHPTGTGPCVCIHASASCCSSPKRRLQPDYRRCASVGAGMAGW